MENNYYTGIIGKGILSVSYTHLQARNQQAFIDAVKVAIRDGFKESNIGITVPYNLLIS